MLQKKTLRERMPPNPLQYLEPPSLKLCRYPPQLPVSLLSGVSQAQCLKPLDHVAKRDEDFRRGF